MSLDSLFKVLPESPWLWLLAVLVIVYLMTERIVNFIASVADRRSDMQLLDQAEKAALIMEKLPKGHRSHADLLVYVSCGPISELSKRQSERLERQSNAEKRKGKRFSMIFSVTTVSLFFIPLTPETIADFLRVWTAQGAPFALRFWIFVFGVGILLLLYISLILIMYGFTMVADSLGEGLTKITEKARNKVIRRRQEKKGRGGVYEI